MSDIRLMMIGLIGTAVIAILVFTPLPEALLGAIGLSGLTGWFNQLVLLGLFVLIAMTLYAIWKQWNDD